MSCDGLMMTDNEIAFTIRNDCPDGTGMDFEGDNRNCVFSHNHIHDNDGPGMLVMSTVDHNYNILMENNVFYNNAVNPYKTSYQVEFLSHNASSTGEIKNNSIYKRNDSRWSHFSDRWGGFSRTNNLLSDTRYYTPPPTATPVPTQQPTPQPTATPTATPTPDPVQAHVSWDFHDTQNFLGWNGHYNWDACSVSDGVHWGLASGNGDMFFYSPTVRLDADVAQNIKVRMQQSAGDSVQLFFITETDPVWNVEKSVWLPATSNWGEDYKTYWFDMSENPFWTGVVTQIRVDPTNTVGSAVAIDYIRITHDYSVWDFDTTMDFLGFNGHYQWDCCTVSDDYHWGLSTGPNMFVYTPYLNASTYWATHVAVRMRSFDGATLRVLFVTDEEPFWCWDKRVEVPLISDGVDRTYVLDMSANPDWTGSAWYLRLDPTDATGAAIAIDWVKLY